MRSQNPFLGCAVPAPVPAPAAADGADGAARIEDVAGLRAVAERFLAGAFFLVAFLVERFLAGAFFAGLRVAALRAGALRFLAVERFAVRFTGMIVPLTPAPLGAEPAKICPYRAGRQWYAGMPGPRPRGRRRDELARHAGLPGRWAVLEVGQLISLRCVVGF